MKQRIISPFNFFAQKYKKRTTSHFIDDNAEQDPAPKRQTSTAVIVISVIIANAIVGLIIYLICVVF